jgi:cation diffusion facilitator family transporter
MQGNQKLIYCEQNGPALKILSFFKSGHESNMELKQVLSFSPSEWMLFQMVKPQSAQFAEAMRHRSLKGRRVTWLGMWVNAALSLAKAAGGILGGSQALLADALHSISDMASDLVVLFALRFSGEPADRRHPYGHGRMESAAAFGVGVILLMAGIYMLYRSAGDLWIPRPYRLTFLALPFILIAIVLKESLYWLTLRVGRETINPALMANAWHHRSDAISSIAALAGVTLALIGYWRADAIAAAGVAGLVIWTGLKIVRESLDDLVGRSKA